MPERRSVVGLVLLAIVCLIGGVFIGYFASPQIRELMVPAAHKTVISLISVYDKTYGLYQKPVCVGYRQTAMLSLLLGLSIVFTQGKVYDQSDWVWHSEAGDTNFYTTVMGPFDDGKYVVELARSAWNEFEVKVKGIAYIFPTVTETNKVVRGYLTVEL